MAVLVLVVPSVVKLTSGELPTLEVEVAEQAAAGGGAGAVETVTLTRELLLLELGSVAPAGAAILAVLLTVPVVLVFP